MASAAKTILFVDDEINILNGIRRIMHPLRDRWKVRVALGPEAALSVLKTARFDAVVTDMIMPGMSGLELLREIKERWPDTIRIMLSGQSQKEPILHTVDYIHDYLPKPCDSQTLIATLNRAFSIRDDNDKERVLQIVSAMSALPTLPSIYTKLMTELESPNMEIRRVGEIISQDMAIASKVLKLVNSAYFGLRIRVSNPSQAVKLLGVATVKAIALSVEVFSQFESADLAGLSFEDLWSHGSLTGALSQRIASEESDDSRVPDHALIGGLMHDVGILILAVKLPKEYHPVIKIAKERKVALVDVEEELLGVTHAEIGAYLLKTWNLSDQVVEAVAYHHSIRKAGNPKVFSPALAVHIANSLTNAMNPGWKTHGVRHVDTDWIEASGRLNRMDRWKKKLAEMGTP